MIYGFGFPLKEWAPGENIVCGFTKDKEFAHDANASSPCCSTIFRSFSEGPFEIRGAFGMVRIDAERPILKLRGP